MLTADQVRRAAKGPVNAANLNSVLVALQKYARPTGLHLAHRQVPYMAQLMHESGAFRYDREIWGPTPAQARYDVRADLGNTPERDGDGKKYMGRSGIQLTGAANYEAFRDWVWKNVDPNAPDFVKQPDLINTDPWEGLVPIWYWTVGNPERQSLNRYADKGDMEMITRRINGGLNGYADRLDYYTRLALVVLGYGPTEILRFQKVAKAAGKYAGSLDGLDGPQTRSALHLMLVDISGAARPASIMAAPVTVTETVTEEVAVPVAVKPESMDAPWWKSKETWVPAITGGGLTGGLATVGGMPWENLVVIVAALIVAGGVLLYLKNRDAKQVDKAVEELR
jgi:putative chitinase